MQDTKIRFLKEAMAAAGMRFGDAIPLLLTGNGGEFSNVAAFGKGVDGEAQTKMFFCGPCRSSQKPRVEKNHTLFRDIVPKGESFDGFSQEAANLVFSHVNSVKRKILSGKTRCELFVFTYGDRLVAVLGVRPIPAADVVQSPLLLKNKAK
ncbi:MAG: hypothetical protein FWG10_05420 [Eubacteriaceae bacterium]|nr:hypothetical protein [Eubacteriaceae bacterium]